MATKVPTRAVAATKVLLIENAAEGGTAEGGGSEPGPDAGPAGPGAGGGGEEPLGLGAWAGEFEGEVAGAGTGADDLGGCVGAAPGACAMHDVAKRPNIKNTCNEPKPIL